MGFLDYDVEIRKIICSPLCQPGLSTRLLMISDLRAGMERLPDRTSTVTTPDRAPGIADPGRVSGGGRQRPDPEVPQRARRRRFTAQYKLELLAAYDAAADGEKGALLRRGV